MATIQSEKRPGNVPIQEKDLSPRQLPEPQPSLVAPERRLGCQTAIPEEDESNETSSEPQEPVTPTSSDVHSHDFHHHQDATVDTHGTDSHPEMLSKGFSSTSSLFRPSSTTTTATRPAPTPLSTTGLPKTSNDGVVSPRSGLGSRVGSFVRNKLQRSNSRQQVEQAGHALRTPALDTSVSSASLAPQSAAAAFPPARRMSSWSISAMNTPRSSASNSPPAPGSPSSTLNGDNHISMDARTKPKHRHSNSFSRSSGKEGPRHGITWNFGNANKPHPERPHQRHRSASTDLAHRPNTPDLVDHTIGLVDTFSKHAAAGVGMKARRLSTSLPNEYNCDSCELDKEFKSTSFMPGRRGKKLGKGATATVRIMARKGVSPEELVAVKEFVGKEAMHLDDEEEWLQRIKSEFSVANSLHHPNIIETLRLCSHHGKWNHVMEFCPHGEFHTLVERGLFKTHYKLEDRLCFFKQLIRSIDYLHSHGIAHRDIKLENLLMDKDGHLKLNDFGTAEVFSGGHPGLRESGGQCGQNMGEVRLCTPGICGSTPYIAPEVLEKAGEYDPRPVDVWACAIVFVVMQFAGQPWEAAKAEYSNYKVFQDAWNKWLATHPDGEIKDEQDGYPHCGPMWKAIEPPAVKRMLLKMLHPDPQKRITVREICETKYFKSIECCTPDSFEEIKCSINAGVKGGAKSATRKIMPKKHYHCPPKEISKLRQGLTHRFDMGEGWY